MNAFQRLLAVGSGSLLLGASATASLIFDLGTTINGSTPTGTPPFLRAEFQTLGTDSVRLTLTNLMPTTNFVDNWVFNIDPLSGLVFTYESGVAAIDVSSGLNFTDGGSNVKAGLFDIMFHYDTSEANRFHGGLTSVYTITGAGIDENSFLAFSIDNPSSPPSPGGWLSASHVQGFANGAGSGSIGTMTPVPEPATIAVIGLSAVAMIRRRLGRKR